MSDQPHKLSHKASKISNFLDENPGYGYTVYLSIYTQQGILYEDTIIRTFHLQKLLRFVLPSIVMMIFTSIYGVVDGLFVSNYVGKTAFAAVNLIMPFLMAISALGFMIGTGGSAIVAKTLGEGKKSRQTNTFPCWYTSR